MNSNLKRTKLMFSIKGLLCSLEVLLANKALSKKEFDDLYKARDIMEKTYEKIHKEIINK